MLLAVVAGCPLLAWSGETVRLFFRKTATQRPADDRPKHVVREGEWLYKILEDAGISREDFPRVIPQVRAMNPHIEDFNHLRAGQILYLPQAKSKSTASPATTASGPGPSIRRKDYMVQPGETLVQILSRQTGASMTDIYARYIPLVRQMNPHLANLDALRAGDRLEIPTAIEGPEATVANGSAPTTEGSGMARGSEVPGGGGGSATAGSSQGASTPEGTPALDSAAAVPAAPDPPGAPALPAASADAGLAAPLPPPSPVRLLDEGRRRARHALQTLGCSAVPGDEGLFPLEDGSWFAVNLKETPILLTPWGERLLLLDAPKPAAWVQAARDAGFVPVTVPADWELRATLQAVAAALPRRLHLWPAERELVLPRRGLSVTVKAPLLAVLPQDGGRAVVFWPRGPEEPPLPQGVRETLAEADITVVETDSAGAPTATPPLPGQALHLPEATAAWLHAQLAERFPEIRPLTSAGQILALLRHTGRLTSRHLTLSWVRGSDRSLTLQVPAWVVDGTPPLALLEETSPAVVALLAREGYRCARLAR